jgi:hypothetical protein
MEAAGLLGIDLYRYSKIERGAHKPGRILAVRYRDIAGVDPSDWDRKATKEFRRPLPRQRRGPHRLGATRGRK